MADGEGEGAQRVLRILLTLNAAMGQVVKREGDHIDVREMLVATEVMASMIRRQARDRGVAREDVHHLRSQASALARNFYEESGMAKMIRRVNDVEARGGTTDALGNVIVPPPHDPDKTVQLWEQAEGMAADAIARALAGAESPPKGGKT